MSPRPSIENGRAASAVGNRSCRKTMQSQISWWRNRTDCINKDSSLTTSTDLYWSIKRFSHTDHNWSEEHPENVVDKKSCLKMQKVNAFTYECQWMNREWYSGTILKQTAQISSARTDEIAVAIIFKTIKMQALGFFRTIIQYEVPCEKNYLFQSSRGMAECILKSQSIKVNSPICTTARTDIAVKKSLWPNRGGERENSKSMIWNLTLLKKGGRPSARRLPLEWGSGEGVTEASLTPANMQGGCFKPRTWCSVGELLTNCTKSDPIKVLENILNMLKRIGIQLWP